MKKLIIFLVVAVAMVGLIGYSLRGRVRRPTSSTVNPNVAAAAPDFSLKDYQGNTFTLNQFRGEAVVVNSWASWCPFCRQELPDFAAVQKEFGDKAVIVAVDRAEPLEVAKRYSDDLGVTASLVFLLDPADSFYQSIGGFSMPETIFVAKDGTIHEHVRGPINAAAMREKIRGLL